MGENSCQTVVHSQKRDAKEYGRVTSAENLSFHCTKIVGKTGKVDTVELQWLEH